MFSSKSSGGGGVAVRRAMSAIVPPDSDRQVQHGWRGADSMIVRGVCGLWPVCLGLVAGVTDRADGGPWALITDVVHFCVELRGRRGGAGAGSAGGGAAGGERGRR